MRMAVTLQDVIAHVQAATLRPEAAFGDGTSWTARDLGRHAKNALEEHATRQAMSFLKSASEAETVAASGTAFADALALFRIWLDQVVECSACPECGSALGRACTMNGHNGQPIAREWIHAARIPAAPGVLA